MKTWIELDYIGFFWACGLVSLTVALSFWSKLKLEREILLVSGQVLLQLLMMGSFLALIMAFKQPLLLVLGICLFLTLSAFSTAKRISNDLPWLFSLVWISLLISTLVAVSWALVLIIRPDAQFLGQYIIALALMIISSSAQAAVIAGERLVGELRENRLEIETHLCLGATAREAIFFYRREAIKAGLSLNQIKLVGLITLPNLLGGQILSGVDPLNAASYQLLLVFMGILANLITVLLITEGILRSYVNSAEQLIR